MGDFLRTWLIQIAAVIVFVSLIEMLVPAKGMKKFVRMILSLVVILTILKPFIFFEKNIGTLTEEISSYSNFMEASDYDLNTEAIQTFNEEKAAEVFQNSVATMVAETAGDFNNIPITPQDVKVQLNEKNQIVSIKIYQGKSEEKANDGKVHSIETIQIDTKKDIINGDNSEYILDESNSANRMRKHIAQKFDVGEESILLYCPKGKVSEK